MPIYREMEAVWFRAHGQDATTIFTMPQQGQAGSGAAPAQGWNDNAARSGNGAGVAAAQGYAGTPGRPPLPGRVPGGVAPPAPYTPPAPSAPAPAPYRPAATAVPEPATAPPVPVTDGPPSGGGSWRTAADEGWVRASRAAEPANAGTTRSGLPKRVPQAPLVPGGVAAKGGAEPSRRTPDEVRGLLSAYHRGVQRGRSAGGVQNGTTSTKETSG